MSNILIKHVRDSFRKPFATVVAIGKDKVGVTLCHSKEHFKKSEGVIRATERAHSLQNTPPIIPNQYVYYGELDSEECELLSLEEVLTKEYAMMIERSRRYFCARD